MKKGNMKKYKPGKKIRLELVVSINLLSSIVNGDEFDNPEDERAYFDYVQSLHLEYGNFKSIIFTDPKNYEGNFYSVCNILKIRDNCLNVIALLCF